MLGNITDPWRKNVRERLVVEAFNRQHFQETFVVQEDLHGAVSLDRGGYLCVELFLLMIF